MQPYPLPTMEPCNVIQGVVKQIVNSKGNSLPYALIHEKGNSYIRILLGVPDSADSIHEIGFQQIDRVGPGNVVKAFALPYNAVEDRGLPGIEGDPARLFVMHVCGQYNARLEDLLACIPKEPISLAGGVCRDLESDEAQGVFRQIIEQEIGGGNASTCVHPLRLEARIAEYSRTKLLRIFANLLTSEPNAFMHFCMDVGDRTLVGASPERHVRIEGTTLRMHPISGTFRKFDGMTKEDFLAFLRNPKEIGELVKVLDEEGKVAARLCPMGGRILGPNLENLSRVVHTSYALEGETHASYGEILAAAHTQATVSGSPYPTTPEIIARYEQPRGFYSGAVGIAGRGEDGTSYMESAIAIRMAEIFPDGTAHVRAGSTLVHDSDPADEVKECEAKAAGLLSVLQGKPSPQFPGFDEILNDADVQRELTKRNANLSSYHLHDQHACDLRVPELTNKKILVINAEDDFAFTLGQMATKMGAHVMQTCVKDADQMLASSDIVILGPGTGDPRGYNEKMRSLRRIAKQLKDQRIPHVGICLGHQILCDEHGLELQKKDQPTQGVQADIDLFGTPQTVGFYNSFTGKKPVEDRTDIEICADETTGDVHALKGKGFASVQFHPESVMTPKGFEILRDLFLHALQKPTNPAFQIAD